MDIYDYNAKDIYYKLYEILQELERLQPKLTDINKYATSIDDFKNVCKQNIINSNEQVSQMTKIKDDVVNKSAKIILHLNELTATLDSIKKNETTLNKKINEILEKSSETIVIECKKIINDRIDDVKLKNDDIINEFTRKNEKGISDILEYYKKFANLTATTLKKEIENSQSFFQKTTDDIRKYYLTDALKKSLNDLADIQTFTECIKNEAIGVLENYGSWINLLYNITFTGVCVYTGFMINAWFKYDKSSFIYTRNNFGFIITVYTVVAIVKVITQSFFTYKKNKVSTQIREKLRKDLENLN